jgi:hypothetical protein
LSLDESTIAAPVAAQAELALYRNRISTLEAEIAMLQARLLTKLAVESEEVQTIIAASLEDSKYCLQVMERDHQHMVIEVLALRASLEEALAGQQVLRAEKENLLASFSWKITRPLRSVVRRLPMLHGLMGRLLGGRGG